MIEIAEQWVALACGDPKCTPPFTRFLHVIDGIAYGTDRKRVHCAPTQFPDGVYDPVTFMPAEYKGFVVDFATLASSMDRNGAACTTAAELTTGWEGVETVEFMRVAKKDGSGDRGVGVAPRYIKDAVQGDPQTVLFFTALPKMSVFGNSRFGAFLIMGLRGV